VEFHGGFRHFPVTLGLLDGGLDWQCVDHRGSGRVQLLNMPDVVLVVQVSCRLQRRNYEVGRVLLAGRLDVGLLPSALDCKLGLCHTPEPEFGLPTHDIASCAHQRLCMFTVGLHGSGSFCVQ